MTDSTETREEREERERTDMLLAVVMQWYIENWRQPAQRPPVAQTTDRQSVPVGADVTQEETECQNG